ncbi:hypothetical protein SAY87_023039 [Trapa incisa]|uniref:Cation efflux protein transmembrane domain-containing protein n=1 Tax=Trapa incisa TaxID=236973 RepID=A0AAN7K8R7_9MYRT|nr:hypothetical protein SAY87_023039 [Trapa incisa]
MADHHHHHHHHHRPNRISVPPRGVSVAAGSFSSRPSYPLYGFPPSTPTPTPSKARPFSSLTSASRPSKPYPFSSLILLLFSLRSLYSLFPFIRSSPPSFSLFPFSFLVSLLSFLLTILFSLQNRPFIFLSSISRSQHKIIAAKSCLLAIVFLLRFQALRYCGAAAMILAELSGNVAARFIADAKGRNVTYRMKDRMSRIRGFLALFVGLFLLALSWDRIYCFPFSNKSGFMGLPEGNCIRVWPMVLPFLSGFLGCYERISMNWGTIRELGRKRVRLVSLFYTTVLLFIPAVIGFLIFEHEGDSISIGNLGWPLANTVVFGVLLSENYSDDKLSSSRDFRREFLVTCACTLVLELFYFPELSLWGLLLCGILLYIAVTELDPVYTNYLEMGVEQSNTLFTLGMTPIRHILSERKSRKIALFLLINAGYMVVEFVVGFMSNSLGLISDACHMLFDCAALAIGLYASYISRLPANSQFNYGRGRFEVLSGYVNAVFLVLVGALIVLESIERILDPQEISTNSLLAVSVGGFVVNVIGLIFFHEEHHHAHGGSCSHSHSHSHSHHHQHGHIDESHGKNEESITVACNSHGSSCTGLDDDHKHLFGDDDGKCCDKVADSGGHAHSHLEIDHSHGHGNDSAHHGPCEMDHSHGHGNDHEHHGPCEMDHSHDHGNDFAHHGPCEIDHGSCNHGHMHTQPGVQQCHQHLHQDHHHPLISCNQADALPSEKSPTRNFHGVHIDHNMEGIFLHVLADTLGSVGVVISTLLIKYRGWLVADPACSIFISVMIVSSVIPLLRNSAEVLLQRVPRTHEHGLFKAAKSITKMKGVHGIRKMHVWSLTNTDVVGTLHLHVETDMDKALARAQVSHILQDAGVKDLTVQVECVKSS